MSIGADTVSCGLQGALIVHEGAAEAGRCPLAAMLEQNRALRQTADYKTDHVTEVRASRALRRTEEFLTAIRDGGGQ